MKSIEVTKTLGLMPTTRAAVPSAKDTVGIHVIQLRFDKVGRVLVDEGSAAKFKSVLRASDDDFNSGCTHNNCGGNSNDSCTDNGCY